MADNPPLTLHDAVVTALDNRLVKPGDVVNVRLHTVPLCYCCGEWVIFGRMS